MLAARRGGEVHANTDSVCSCAPHSSAEIHNHRRSREPHDSALSVVVCEGWSIQIKINENIRQKQCHEAIWHYYIQPPEFKIWNENRMNSKLLSS